MLQLNLLIPASGFQQNKIQPDALHVQNHMETIGSNHQLLQILNHPVLAEHVSGTSKIEAEYVFF